MLKLVGIDPIHLRSYPHQLSGGMRQRAMIAMALLFTPDLVIMDEPTSALDVVAQRSLMVQIKQLQQQLGFAVLFVTHDMSLVSHFSDRLVVMYAGQVVESGPTRTVFDEPAHPYSRGLLDAFPSIRGPRVQSDRHPGTPARTAQPAVGLPVPSALPGRDGSLPSHRARSLPGRALARPLPQTRAGSRPGGGCHMSEPLLETRGLTKHFKVGGNLSRKTLHAVDDANLVINPREIVALVGESGSGKSTIARLLARVYEPTSGEILYQGRSLRSMRTRRQTMAYRSDVPMVFQDPFSSLNPAFRVSHGIMRGLKLHRPDLARAEARAEAERVVEAVGLSPAAEILDRYPYELSGGQRQRIGFAQALAYRPKLILADEPVSMLDVSIRVGLLNLMTDAARRRGRVVPVHHARPGQRALRLRPAAGHVRRAHRRVRPDRERARRPQAPLHPAAAVGSARPAHAARSSAASDTGEPPRVIDPTPGCRFRWRCPLAIERCGIEDPVLRELAPEHSAACHVAAAVADAVSAQ